MNSINQPQIIEATSPEPFLLHPDSNPDPDQDYIGCFPLYQQKMMGWMARGYSREEAEEKCKPKEIDREALMEQVMKEQEKQLRWLAKLSPKRSKPPKPRKSDCTTNDEIEIAWVDIKCPDQFKTRDSVQN